MKMRIEEESPITRYLVNNLRPLTEADPSLLANYVIALLKNNKPKKELQRLCVDKLYDFLGDGTKSFVTKLFHALDDGSIPTSIKEIEGTELNEATIAVVSGGPTELRSSSPQPERLTSAAVCILNENEEKEISDDEDDDRNHKHKRRVTRSQSLDPDGQSDDEKGPSKKRGRHPDNDQPVQESKLQFSDRHREYSSSQTERDISVKNERKRHVSSPSSRLNVDGGHRAARGSQAYRNESGGRFDGQNFFSRSGLGRGRGRNIGAWAPHDSRFTSVETVDFTSAIPPQGASSVKLYSGTGRPIPNAVNSANSSWNPLGMIPGIPSGGIEQLHPMHAGMQGGRGTTLNSTIGIGIGMGRPRCRDFEERGFCLRGDMCPMEHGLNRIVVEDVQSLSQFNLPVSLPGGHMPGIKSGAVGGHSSAVVSTPAPSSKISFSKNTKYRANEDTDHLNGMTFASTENEPDFYDPDQPLWDKDHPDSSHGLMQLPSSGKGEEEHLWDDNSSDRHSCRLSDGDNERPGKTLGTVLGSHDVVPSVWGRLGPVDHDVNKSGFKRKGDMSNEAVQCGKLSHKQVYDEQNSYGRGSLHQEICDIETEGYEHTALKRAKIPFQQGKVEGSVNLGVHGEPVSNLTSDPVARGNVSRGTRGKGTERALRTLFVNCIPFQSNKRELLLSHFQKFGEVLDIHIPKNSERAFVQFCKRESSEAALASPDAVMGNRFIRLSWANRDSILAGGESGAPTVSPGKSACGGTSTAQPQQLLAGKGKQKVNDVSPVVSGISMLEQPPMETGGLKAVTANDISNPSIPMVQKRQEKLELLEEIRRKQETLAQKRDNFRRQLDKLERQGSVSRLDSLDRNQGVKQQKTDLTAESPYTDPAPGSDNSVVKENCGDVQNQIAGSSLSPATLTHPSPKAFKAPYMRFPRLATEPVFNPNRFKLDNRPTAFKILPPLPASLDMSAMKKHFEKFGGMSSVEFDDGEGHEGEASKTEKFSIRVAYTTRRAAERAFSHGKTWQGQNLQFAWVMPSNNALSHSSLDNAVCQTSKGFDNGAITTETEVHDQPHDFEKESSGLIAQVENDTSDSKEARVNGVRNEDSIAEVSTERCGHQLKYLNDEVSQSDPHSLSSQSHAASAASKLDGSNNNINSFAQTDIPTEVP